MLNEGVLLPQPLGQHRSRPDCGWVWPTTTSTRSLSANRGGRRRLARVGAHTTRIVSAGVWQRGPRLARACVALFGWPRVGDAVSMASAHTRSFGRLAVDRIRQDRGLRLMTTAAMVGFVVAVYVLVVVGGGALVGHAGTPGLWLSVLATAVVAIAFEPVRTWVVRRLSRALHRDRLSPYQVLARFPKTVTGAYPAEELPARMARVLAGCRRGPCTVAAPYC